ncbi:MAG: sugar ABC transporter permease [Clostridia bacterium]|nr:sugar ABC transporter permease [Clostridia bacterium]
MDRIKDIPSAGRNKVRRGKRWVSRDYTLFAAACMGLAFLLVFAYVPMAGIIIAFKDDSLYFNIFDVIKYGGFVGFANFAEFFRDQKFWDVMANTLGLNLLMLLINFPAPIIFALLLNEILHSGYKKAVQTLSIFPHFISWVVFGGIVIALADMTTGIFNPVMYFFGIGSRDDPVNLLTAKYFWPLIITISMIKGVGWGSVIYLAAITNTSPELYEAAQLDGADRFKRALYITLPSIAPTVTVFLLLNISGLLSNNFEQFYVLQNPANTSRSEVLATYIYQTGMIERKYAYTTAMGFFESTIGIILMLSANAVSKKIANRGLFG